MSHVANVTKAKKKSSLAEQRDLYAGLIDDIRSRTEYVVNHDLRSGETRPVGITNAEEKFLKVLQGEVDRLDAKIKSGKDKGRLRTIKRAKQERPKPSQGRR